MARRLIWRKGAKEAVLNKAAEDSAQSETHAARAALIVRNLSKGRPIRDVREYKLRRTRKLFVYNLHGVRIEYFDDGKTVEIVTVEFSP